MKSGTGDDPFADDAGESDDGADAGTTETDADDAPVSDAPDAEPQTSSPSDADATSDAPDAPDGDAEETTGASDDGAETATGAADADGAGAKPDAPDIPWVLRRSSVKADRPNVTQFFLRDETDRAERRFQSDVEDILDADVYTLDLREAAYVVAMRHPEEVAAELRDWGYEYMD